MNENTKPTLPPALRKPSPKMMNSVPLTSSPSVKPANSVPSPTPAPPPSTVQKPTGETITKTPPSSSLTKNSKLFVPPPTPTSNPRLPVLDDESWIEGSFICEGNDPFVVETRLTGDPTRDHQSLVNLARKKYPTGKMKQASTRIFMRSRGTPPGYAAGTNLGQIFGEAGSDTETGVEVGHVFFEGSRCQIFLRNLRSRNAVTVMLRPAAGGQIVFSNQVAPNRPVTDLGLIIKEILGQGARELTITLREAK